MSIVLVIIGFIVGGVLVGRDLILQAELRKLVSDVEHYKTAVNAFRDKYGCLPGDCANATNFFGISSTGCATPDSAYQNSGFISATGGTGTCNGSGNGIVDDSCSGNNFCVLEREEPALVFNHLGLAGMVPNSYDGSGHGATSEGLQAGANVPYTIRNGGINMMTDYVGDTSNPVITNVFSVLGTANAEGNYNSGSNGGENSGGTGLLTPMEAQSLDTKFDDGLPVTGNILAGPWTGSTATSCMIAPHVAASQNLYRVSNTGHICGLAFQFGLN